jgi:hypothetical protein
MGGMKQYKERKQVWVEQNRIKRENGAKEAE